MHMLTWLRDKLNVSRLKISNAITRRDTNEVLYTEEEPSNAEMLVADTNLFPTDYVKLHIIGADGSVWTIDAPPDLTIGSLKAMALSHFYNPVESAKLLPNFKMIAVSTRQALQTDSSIQQEQLAADEEILLVECRVAKLKETINDDHLKGPSQDDINSLTAHLTRKNVVKCPPPLDCTEDFQSEIRKILISLVEVAAQLLTARPDAEEIFASIAEKLDTRDKTVPDKNSIKNLTEMGFSEEKVILALRLKRNNATDALDWLLEKGASKVDLSSSSLENTNEKEVEKEITTSGHPTVAQSVAKLLATFRAYRRKEFRPNAKALQSLLEMGFQEKDIVEALRITGNNSVSACEWLLGERTPSLQDFDTGLDPDGPIYKALLANPAIQLGLNNPKMLLAFLSILENNQSANMWLNDPDAAPVLNQIFKTYHAEKHILTVNRHVETFNTPQPT